MSAPIQVTDSLHTRRLEAALTSALTRHDERQRKGRYWNPAALSLYLEALERVMDAVRRGWSVERALRNEFNDRLLDKLLKAAAEISSPCRGEYCSGCGAPHCGANESRF